MAKRSNRLLPKRQFKTQRRKLPRYGGKGSALVTRSLTGPLAPVPHNVKRPCMPSKGKGIGKGTCRSELVFHQGQVHLRLCHAKGKVGPIVPVSSPSEATRISREFCECVTRSKNAKACVARLGKDAPLGRFSGLKRRGFKVPGWHHARGMPEVHLAPAPPCQCGHAKGMHYGRGHTGECMEIGCPCRGYRPAR